jgi:hypothetical protein
MPSATPSLDLAAPTGVFYDEINNIVTWQDNAVGEDGYRLDVTFGRETRTFQVGPNAQTLLVPADFRRGCPNPGPQIDIRVTPFAGSIDGQPGRFYIGAECPPTDLTPTPITGASLPPTGGGPDRESSATFPIAALALAAVGLSSAGIWLARRRLLR